MTLTESQIKQAARAVCKSLSNGDYAAQLQFIPGKKARIVVAKEVVGQPLCHVGEFETCDLTASDYADATIRELIEHWIVDWLDFAGIDFNITNSR